jgi:hypothetical protein
MVFRKEQAITAIKEALAQPVTKHAEELVKLGWQYFDCPACGSEGARAFPKPEQEPVAFAMFKRGRLESFWMDKGDAYEHEFTPEHKWESLYTIPPQRTWVGLTEDDNNGFELGLASCTFERHDPQSFIDGARWAEAKLRSKNT